MAGTPVTGADRGADMGYVARGACPFECCVYGDWTLLTAALLRSAPGASDSAGVLPPNTPIRADSGLAVVNPVGLAVVEQSPAKGIFEDTINLRVGDTLELLDYEGEGYRNVRVRGRRLLLTEYWSAETDAKHGIRLVRKPESRWWVHATAGARRGWMLMDSVRVRGADACGG